MRNIIIAALLLISQVSLAQINQNKKPGVVKYDFSTYNGDPIQTGWLFDDETYRKLYTSYNAADTAMIYFQEQGKKLEKIFIEFTNLKQQYEEKAAADSKIILDQQTSIGRLNTLLTSATEDNEKILKQFFKIGGVRLHKGTFISVGTSAIVIGYLAGKAL